MTRGFSDGQARRRRARELRQLRRDLDRLERRRQRRTRAGLPRARTTTSLLLAVLLAVLAVACNPTSTGERIRAMLGIGQDLTFTITDTGGATYAFAMLQPDGRAPVTWDGCREIHYVVNPDGAPAGHPAIVAAAAADLERASGLRLRYDGTTHDRTFEDRAGPFGSGAPVLVAWATPEEVPELAGDVAGVGGAEARALTPGRLTYVTGMVALDRDAFAAMARRPGGTALQRAVVEHELGHVLGLGHVDDPAQLMYAETTGQRRLAPGDRAGLAVLGDGPCG
ncbi:matrixin family metalloprotease [Nocardioides sp.]|uniref:matrixin family metalloprotease n=1 Tax=Nocardioides sp. TaxID=35761 RepID=UPI002EDB66FA